jgi:hypothetical protein
VTSSGSSNAKRSRLDSVVTRPPVSTTGALHRPPKLANWLHGRGCPSREPNRGARGGGGNWRWNRGYGGGVEYNSYRGQFARGRYARGRYARGRGERGKFGNQYWWKKTIRWGSLIYWSKEEGFPMSKCQYDLLISMLLNSLLCLSSCLACPLLLCIVLNWVPVISLVLFFTVFFLTAWCLTSVSSCGEFFLNFF